MEKHKHLFCLFLFSFLGGICRYYGNLGLSIFLPSILATFFLNWLGTFFLIFFVKGYLVFKERKEELILGLGTGFCGSFTTLSSSLLDLYKLLHQGHYILFLSYGLILTIGGLIVARLSLTFSNEVFLR